MSLLDAAQADWSETVDRVNSMLCLPKLTIRLYVSYAGLVMKPTTMTREQVDLMAEQYADFLKPLSRLEDLGHFFVHIVSPFPWFSAAHFMPMRIPEAMQNRARQIEQDMERFVMGNDYVAGHLKTAKYRDPQFVVALQRRHWY